VANIGIIVAYYSGIMKKSSFLKVEMSNSTMKLVC